MMPYVGTLWHDQITQTMPEITLLYWNLGKTFDAPLHIGYTATLGNKKFHTFRCEICYLHTYQLGLLGVPSQCNRYKNELNWKMLLFAAEKRKREKMRKNYDWYVNTFCNEINLIALNFIDFWISFLLILAGTLYTCEVQNIYIYIIP